jgi:hypothetical protein
MQTPFPLKTIELRPRQGRYVSGWSLSNPVMLEKAGEHCAVVLPISPPRYSESLLALPKELAVVRPTFIDVTLVKRIPPACDTQAGPDVMQVLRSGQRRRPGPLGIAVNANKLVTVLRSCARSLLYVNIDGAGYLVRGLVIPN